MLVVSRQHGETVDIYLAGKLDKPIGSITIVKVDRGKVRLGLAGDQLVFTRNGVTPIDRNNLAPVKNMN